ncbi:MAG: type I restriction endonuclease subunit R [Candidatus Nanopelagicales bacterium]|nr:type I restriction endonuclease subunit R [Candidatus Nanopelagicales bacterium]
MREAGLESYVLDLFQSKGWAVLHGPDVAPGMPGGERSDYRQVVLTDRLRDAVLTLNPGLPMVAVEDVVKTVLRPESQSAFQENWRAYQLLVGGVPVEYRDADSAEVTHVRAHLIDWENPGHNDLLVMNQVTIKGKSERRPDVLVYVNGLPLALFELKRPGEANATIKGAFNQIQTYKSDIPDVFTWNQVTVISDGVSARAGTYSGRFEHFAPWKTIDGIEVTDGDIPQIEVLVAGLFRAEVFLDLVHHFVVFSDEQSGPVKKVAKYHQYWAVRQALARTVEALHGDGRVGVVWHTQGSGKSLEMHTYAGAVMRHPAMRNPTVVVITDRNDLDNQLYEEVFASSRPQAPLPEAPKQAESRQDLQDLLASRGSGGIVFTTIQKFGLTKEDREAGKQFPLLSDRANIVVIVDEAHRSNYDFIDGFARNVRDALPNASFIGFTGTPIESKDKSTTQVFGDYISVYDLTQAEQDGATVKVYYEPRLARVELPADGLKEVDEAFAEATSGSEDEAAERLKSRWAKVEAIVGSDKRIKELCADLVEHWEARKATLAGKCMVVAMSRRIAVQMYNEIVALRPEWHSDDDDLGKVKVVITGSAADPEDLQPHIRNKEGTNAIKSRAKNPSDELEMVIVRDMWLTGFDSPPMHTMYVDKPMSGANLMQAITRINRTFKDKPSGLVVDYIGIADDLKAALAAYSPRDKTNHAAGQDIHVYAVPGVIEKHGVVCDILHGYPWRERLAEGGDKAFLHALTGTVNYLLGQHVTDQAAVPEGMHACSKERLCLKCRFVGETQRLIALYTLCSTAPAVAPLRDDVAFFSAVRAEINKIEGPNRRDVDPGSVAEAAVKQIVSEATMAAGVIDIYAEAGLSRPDISLIDEKFIEAFPQNPNKNLAIEAIRRMLNDEIRRIGTRNIVTGRRFSEMLQDSINSYQNRSLDSAQVMAELFELAQHIQKEHRRGVELGLTEDQLAFYDAIASNPSAMELGDETLKKIAQELLVIVRRDATTDWSVKEQVRAKLRMAIKMLLRRYKYPPDRQEEAVALVIQQAEVIAGAA